MLFRSVLPVGGSVLEALLEELVDQPGGFVARARGERIELPGEEDAAGRERHVGRGVGYQCLPLCVGKRLPPREGVQEAMGGADQIGRTACEERWEVAWGGGRDNGLAGNP